MSFAIDVPNNGSDPSRIYLLTGATLSLILNILLVWEKCRSRLAKYRMRRNLGLLWGDGNAKRIEITFSRFPVDDPSRFGSERAVTHLGDAQSLQRLVTFLKDRFSRKATVCTTEELAADADMVLIGGPAFNRATAKLLNSLRGSMVLAHDFCQTDRGAWFIRDSPAHVGKRELILDGRRVAEDFAIIGRFKNPNHSDNFCLLLAGLSTFGTLGAASYVCDPERVRELFTRHPDIKGKEFTALLTVRPDDEYVSIKEASLKLISVGTVEVVARANA